MDCGNFCISWLLKQNNKDYNGCDFIFSEAFPGVSLLPKIWILLLESWYNVEILHENKDIFVNINEDEKPLLNEYKYWLNEFQNKWWMYRNNDITIEFIKEKLNNHYCIIPIKKWEGSHFVILSKIDNDTVTLIDNKKWEYIVSRNEFEDLINLYNWKYILFAFL